MYRYLAVTFEKTDLLVVDARTLATQNLGILNLPKYFSRLMQTLEPAFDQLIRLQILASYHVVSSEEWKIALHRHPSYVPATQTLMLESPAGAPELQRAQLVRLLEKAGFTVKHIAVMLPEIPGKQDFYAVQRAVRLLDSLKENDVLPHSKPVPAKAKAATSSIPLKSPLTSAAKNAIPAKNCATPEVSWSASSRTKPSAAASSAKTRRSPPSLATASAKSA